jgi:chemotaxis methyl-accepting protein methylase
LRNLPPDARIDGFDISGDQFPPKDLMPENLHFYEHDCFQPFAPEFQNQYDVVNIRFFAPVMNSSKVEPVLKNFLSLLSKFARVEIICKSLLIFKRAWRIHSMA